jgi:hypothetical protein
MASPTTFEAGIDFTRVDATQKYALGIEVRANDGCTYKYCRSGAILVANGFVIVDVAEGAYDVVHPAAVALPCAGIAPVATTDNDFTWIKIRGKHVDANVATNAAAGLPVGSTASSGRFDVFTIGADPNQAEVVAVAGAQAGVGVLVRVTAASNKAEVVLT